MTRSGKNLRYFTGVLAGAAALAAVLVAASLVGSRGEKAEPAAASPAPAERTLAGIPQNGAVLGNPRAPVTLVEYADLQCPYCAQWALATLPVLVSDYVRAGKLRIVFRGLAFIGTDSHTALRTAVAAGRQDRLWDVVDALYRNQGVENSGWVTDELLAGMTARIPGLDAGRLHADREGPAVDRELRRAARAATSAGVRGTPAFQIGPTGGTLELVEPSSLGPEGLLPAIEAALAA
jgi:protein-disulfide isomerase